MIKSLKKIGSSWIDMDHLTIRALCSSDIPLIVNRFSQANWPKPQSTFESYLEEQEIGDRVIWVACWDKQFVGYVTLNGNPIISHLLHLAYLKSWT